MKSLIEKSNPKKILALIFIFLIFYIGFATLPMTLIEIGEFFNDKENSFKKRVFDFINNMDGHYEEMLDFKSKNLHNRGFYINLNGFLANKMGQIEMNDRVKLKNGHLAAYSKVSIDVTPTVESLTRLSEKQAAKEKHFLIVISPHQISKFEDLMPDMFVDSDYTNKNADKLVNELIHEGVEVLDLRDLMVQDGIDHNESFYVTDHHWKPELGFWAYTKIVDYMIKEEIINPINSKYTDFSNYETEVLEKWFLGSSGKRTGKYYAGVDDFTIIKPKFEVNLSLELVNENKLFEGPFEDVIYDKRRFVNKEYFTNNPYGAYGHGDKGLIRYKNENAHEDLSLLLIGDSYANVPYPFMSLINKNTEQLDMRHFKGNFENYYEELSPDLVIVLINTQGVTSENVMFEFSD